MNIACYLSLTIEIRTGTGTTLATRPLINLTRPVATFYRIRSRIHRLAHSIDEAVSRLGTAATVAGIGLTSLKFALMGV